MKPGPGQANPIEVELKFLATGSAPLRRLARRRRLGPARLGPPETVDEVDRYLDTDDGRLATARWACRLRTRGDRVIVSLKGPPEAARSPAGLHRRPEVEGPARASLDPLSWPASAARGLLLELSGGGRLAERLALHQRRTERAVLVGDARVGELSLDRVVVTRGRERGGTLWTAELELVADSVADLGLIDALRNALAKLSGLAADRLTKLEHAEAMLRHAGS
ncbi:MAG TPA: CYTH domain-containing protein [Candidatus Limnocylindria bacterium]|nr:CYTH domain-containing protein [Candidatus Limnocylindria bacterium]